MKFEITVRPLRRGEENIWVSLSVPEIEKENRQKKLKKYLAKNPNLPPENYLLAYRGEHLVGKMSGIAESAGYILTGMNLADSVHKEEVAEALLKAINHFGKLEALSWAREDNVEWRNLLQSIGFVEKQDKSYYRKEIGGYVSPFQENFSYMSMAELGETAILKIHKETYEGNLNRNFNMKSPDHDFYSHMESAGELFDPQSWYVMMEDQKLIGIVLPQRFPDDPRDGTLMSVGLIPAARGKGYGKILHAKGMEFLARQGATGYVGSTDVQNQPMNRIFERNECKFIGIRTSHVRVR